jgi:hypothetical protein
MRKQITQAKLQGVEVGEKVLEVGGIGVREGGHEVMAVEDGGCDAGVIGGSSAGQVRLFVDTEQRWALYRSTRPRTGIAVVMAQRAAGLEILIAESLLRGELIDGCGRGSGAAAEEKGCEEDGK